MQIFVLFPVTPPYRLKLLFLFFLKITRLRTQPDATPLGSPHSSVPACRGSGAAVPR